jgi:hypothetical protein
MTLGAEG